MSKRCSVINVAEDSVSKQKEMNWSLCVLCQEEKEENLTCPFKTKRTHGSLCGYSSLSKHLKQFNEIGKLPTSVPLEKLDEGGGVEATLLYHKASWHKTCRNKYDDRKLRLAINQVSTAPVVVSTPKKRTRLSLGKEANDREELLCFFCDKSLGEASKKFRKAATKVIDERVRRYATYIGDTKLISKLSDGDMVAVDAVYHSNCLTSFYGRYNRAMKEQSQEKDYSDLEVRSYSIAFAELVAFIEQTRLDAIKAPVFKLADLAKLYKSRLQQLLGKDLDHRIHTSKLKERILNHIPSMTSYSHGRDVLLLFDEDVGDAVMQACNSIIDSETVHLARAATIIRRELFKEELNQQFEGFFDESCQETSVPRSLITLIDMIMKGPSIEDQTEQHNRQAALTAAQLIKFNSVKRSNLDAKRIVHTRAQETPLPLYIALMLHTHTRKRELVDKMFELGISVSYDRVLRVSSDMTAAACKKYETENVVCPVSLRGNLFTTAAIDNIDHNLTSTTAKESFHGTSISLFQHPLYPGDGTDRDRIFIKESTLSRSVPQIPAFYTEVPTLAPHNIKKNQPTAIANPLETEISSHFIKINYDWLEKVEIAANSQESTDQDNLSWSAYHAECRMSNQHNVVCSPFALLPLFQEDSHSVSMIRHAMDVIRKAVHHVNPGQVPVVTLDQPLYAIAKQIQWTWPQGYGEENFVILPGGLHIEMASFKVAGDWLCGSGWIQMLVEAGITTIGTAESYIKVSHLSRTRHAHQVTLAALYILQKRAYCSYIEATDDQDPEPLDFALWCTVMAAKYPQFKYWATTMTLELTILLFVQSLRDSNYTLYVQALTELVPWFFAFDHTHYARWISISLADLAELPSRLPEIAKEFVSGNFTVKRTTRAFSAIAIDQAHEQNNKIIKEDGGAVGILTDSKKLIRWMVAGPEIARVIQEFQSVLPSSSTENLRHHEQTFSIQQSFLKDVKSLVAAIEEKGNPFEERSADLLVLHSRDIVTSSEALKTVDNALQIGKTQFNDFVTERLIKKSKSIHDVISRNNLALLNSRTRTLDKQKQHLAMVKCNSDLFSRLFISCQVRGGDLEDFFQHENLPYPPSLSTQGNLYLGTKCDLMDCLQEIAAAQREAPVVDAIILDGPVIVQLLSPGAAKTFGEYTQKVFLLYITSQLQRASRVDVVWDTYVDDSLKEQTRLGRGLGIRRRVAADVTIPTDWKSFLRNNENKIELFHFLTQAAANLNVRSRNELIITNGESVVCSSARELTFISPCTHEEADTRTMLHVCDALNTGKKKILIRTVDTDLVVLSIWLVQAKSIEELWVAFGKGNDFRYIPAHTISTTLGPDKSHALLGFHAFTGCDTTSAFVGRGKKTAWNVWNSYPDVTPAFITLSTSDTNEHMTTDTSDLIQRYTVLMYDKTSKCTSVDVARRKLFANKGRTMESIPPTLDYLQLHVKRAARQAKVWSECTNPRPAIPEPLQCGWTRKDGKLQPLWRTLPEVSKKCQEQLVKCGCTKTCKGRCKCKRLGLKCTELCSCDCNN